jgi:hypothetical protein
LQDFARQFSQVTSVANSETHNTSPSNKRQKQVYDKNSPKMVSNAVFVFLQHGTVMTASRVHSLTFNVRMLGISNAAGTPYWPNVRYIERSACVTFFIADDVRFSCKPKQTHWWARQNAWHSSGSITSFMVVVRSSLFMTRLDLRVSAAGNVRRNKAARCTHGET